MTRFRILIVDNLAVESSKRSFHRALASMPEFEVHVMSPRQWQEAGNVMQCEPEDSLLQLHATEVFFRYRQHRVLYKSFPQILATVKPDFIFLDQEPENFAAIQGIRLRRKYAPNAVLSLVSSRNIDHVKVGFPYKAEYLHRQCDRFVVRHPVDVCFVRTQAAVSFMHPYAKQVVHLPFPIEASRFKKIQDRREQPESFTIGYVGRLIEPKGVQMLFDLLPTFPKDVRMLFVGKGPLGEQLSSRARELGINDRLSIRPPVPHKELPNVFSKMDVVVVPSVDTKFWKEQCPRVPMEAMACEVPVIGSNSGGIPEVLGDAGLIFKQRDANALRDSIIRMMQNSVLRDNLAAKGRKRVLENFQVSVVAGRMAETIVRSVSEKSAGEP